MTIQPQLSHSKYRPDIDGLRAIAVLAVVTFHAFPEFVGGGFIGVDIFFVISGYLISTIIFENLEKGIFSFSEFYARRIRRIFPSLLVVIVACFVFGWFELLADEFKQLGKHIAAGTGFISNFVFWSEAGYFDNSADTKPLLHLWSLGIEEQFYITWPILIWLSWRYKLNFPLIALTVGFVSFALSVKGVRNDAVATFYSPQTRFWELIIGSLLAWCAIEKNRGMIANSKRPISAWISYVFYNEKQGVKNDIAVNFFSIAGLCMLIGGFWGLTKETRFPGEFALVPVFGSALIIAAGPHAYINRTLLANKIAVWFGLISFPLYLWHWPLLAFARIVKSETPSLNIRLTVVVLAVVLAWLTYTFVERPLRFGGYKKTKVSALTVLIIVFGCLGYNVHERDGLPFRVANFAAKDFLIPREGIDPLLKSMAWFEGKDDWLFLGDNYDKTVSKLKLAIEPKDRHIVATKELFSSIAETGNEYNTKVVLIIGPDKPSIYPEYLPDNISPSPKKYINHFLNALDDVPNLTVYNPTDDLVKAKKEEGVLYWMTDTHWNNKGAFLAYTGFSRLLNLPVPQVEFTPSSIAHSGDLIGISNLKDFPLHKVDNWDVLWKNKPIIIEREIPDLQKTSYGGVTVATNERPLTNMYAWVSGDSFSVALRQYLNATFKEVKYVGHWSDKLKDLPGDLTKAERRPDIIIIVKVERSF